MPPASSARTTRATATSTCRPCTASTSSSATSTTSTPRRSRRTGTTRRIPSSVKKFGPRGVLKCKADGKGGQTIEDTGPLTKKRMETIDEETLAAAKDFITAQAEGRQAVLLLVERHAHALPHPREGGEPRQVRAGRVQRRHGRARHACRRVAQAARRSRHRQRHHRDVLDRQRPALQHLAGCRHHAVPQREELELGRRLSRARPSCAGPASSRRA